MTEKPPETTPETATARATAAAPNTNHHESTSVKETEVKPEDSQHDHDAEPVYATGFKLFTIMTAITLPCFLMLLDTSIIVTVKPAPIFSFHIYVFLSSADTRERQSRLSPTASTLCPTWAGTVQPT